MNFEKNYSPEGVAGLFQEHREELGFVNVAQCREKTTYAVVENGDVVGAALCNHCVRKPQTTLYDIAVQEDHRHSGVARRLVEWMFDESPHDVVVAKCPVDLPAVQFYNQMGWELVDVEEGKNRSLTVWEYGGSE